MTIGARSLIAASLLVLSIGCADAPPANKHETHPVAGGDEEDDDADYSDDADSDDADADDGPDASHAALMINNVGKVSITGVFAKGTNGWSSNFLPTSVRPGEDFELTVECRRDYLFRYTFSNGAVGEPEKAQRFECGHSYGLDLTEPATPRVTLTIVNKETNLSITSFRSRVAAAGTSQWTDNLLTSSLRPGASAAIGASCNINYLLFIAFSDGSTSQPTTPLKLPCGTDSKLGIEK